MRKIIFDILIIVAVVATIMYVYRTYGDAIVASVIGEQPAIMYVKSTPISVRIADEPEEQRLGLSGTKSMDEFEGMLFVFERENYYSMWMKDMLMSIDMIWINDDMRIVHIEENVKPETYPDSFVSEEPARFVLETNAFFVDSEKIKVGDRVTLPPTALPVDLIHILQ